MPKIAILDDYQEVALEMADWGALPAAAEITVFKDHLAEIDAVAERLADFEIVAIMRERTPFPRALFEKLPKLELLVTSGTGNASIDLAAATDHAVTVCGAGASMSSTAELTWGLILALLRHIPLEDSETRAGKWQVTLGRDLHGGTLGVLGLGRIGSQVAKVGEAFGMTVIAWSPNLTAERAAERDARLVSKDELLAESDVLSIHMRLSERTRGLIGRRELGLMKPTACLINTSRGPIVEEAALIDALRGGKIGGAGLDVFDIEPLPLDHPLRNLENTVITPHLGYVSNATYRAFYGGMAEDIAAYLAGAPIRVMNAA
ncbi:MAG: D-2-hydroxyacid dehydrogenase family protein [Proteobacteria bacterium]|nr:D-2-hydroxyacid dehydrogenase family protein [Pseudomonadota bacterium]